MPTDSTIIGTLDADALQSVVRWSSHVRLCGRSIQMCPHAVMFNPEGPFVDAVRNVYNKITIAELSHVSELEQSSDKRGRSSKVGEESLVVSPCFLRQHKVLECLGPALEEVRLLLTVSSRNHDDGYHTLHHIIPELAMFCKNLKSIELHLPACDETANKNFLGTFVFPDDVGVLIRELLARFGYVLEDLHISRYPCEFNCSALSHSFSKLKSLSLDGVSHLADATVIVQNAGKFLEKIVVIHEDLFAPPDWTKFFGIVRLNCSQLRSIRMWGSRFPRKSYEELLISYGPRLRHVDHERRFEYEWYASMRRVAPHCPNLELFLSCCEKFLSANSGVWKNAITFLDPLAPHIREIEMVERRMNWYGDDACWDAFERFTYLCHKLKIIKSNYLGSLNERALQRLFATPKPSLQMLHMDGEAFMPEKIIRNLMNSTSKLKQLKFRLIMPNNVELVCSLVKSCTNLRRLVLDVGLLRGSVSDGNAEECCRMLESTQECENLKYIRICCRREDYESKTFVGRLSSASSGRFRVIQNHCGIEMYARPVHIVVDDVLINEGMTL